MSKENDSSFHNQKKKKKRKLKKIRKYKIVPLKKKFLNKNNGNKQMLYPNLHFEFRVPYRQCFLNEFFPASSYMIIIFNCFSAA